MKDNCSLPYFFSRMVAASLTLCLAKGEIPLEPRAVFILLVQVSEGVDKLATLDKPKGIGVFKAFLAAIAVSNPCKWT